MHRELDEFGSLADYREGMMMTMPMALKMVDHVLGCHQPQTKLPVTMSPMQQRQQRSQRLRSSSCSSMDDRLRAALEFDVEFWCRTEGALAVRATFGGGVQQPKQLSQLQKRLQLQAAAAATAAAATAAVV